MKQLYDKKHLPISKVPNHFSTFVFQNKPNVKFFSCDKLNIYLTYIRGIAYVNKLGNRSNVSSLFASNL